MAKDVKLSLINAPDRSGDHSRNIPDIVCVHGLGGHPYRTWAAPESSTFWLQDLLPKDLPGSRILTFGYQAQATNLTTEVVSQHAENLLKELVERPGLDPKVSQTPSSLLFKLARGILLVFMTIRCVFALSDLCTGDKPILRCSNGSPNFGVFD